MKREMLSTVMDEIKSAVRQQIINKANINDIEQLNLTKGSIAHISIEQYSTWINYEYTMSNFNAATQLLLEVDQRGFYVVV